MDEQVDPQLYLDKLMSLSRSDRRRYGIRNPLQAFQDATTPTLPECAQILRVHSPKRELLQCERTGDHKVHQHGGNTWK